MTLLTVLPIHCAFCDGAVTLHVTNWPGPNDEITQEVVSWPCPYCQKDNVHGLPGYLAGVTKGHDPDDTVIH